jgi:hypothetical protein
MKFVEAKELEQMSASEANRVLIELQSRVIVLETKVQQMGKYVLKNTDKLYENDKVLERRIASIDDTLELQEM